MSRALDFMLAVSAVMAIGGLSIVVYQLAKHPSADRPTLGHRGLTRARALRSRTFRTLEPLVRYGAGWVERWPLQTVRARVGQRLLHAGGYFGFSASEFLALSAFLGLGFTGVAWVASDLFGLPGALPLLGSLGCLVPSAHASSIARQRASRVNRGLPAAVDLASLCMSAGLDFPGSLARITQSATDPSDPLVEEFARILQELDMGYTRRRALEGFAARVPTDQVKEFVNSVVQAEEKGSPLARVLTIQSQTQRLRRSIAAEEAASGAALMLIGPMTLIFVCVILLLLGPLIVRFTTGDFGAP